MTAVCLYFQVHQPIRLKNYTYFDVGENHHYYADELNRNIMEKVANKCYLPVNQLILDLLKQHEGRFKVAFSVTGTAIEQFKLFVPKVLQSFKDIAATGHAEFLNETYFHSLSLLFSENEFREQVNKHRALIEEEFGLTTTTFRNTELIYNNRLAELVYELGYKTVLLEGADKILKWRSPNHVYTAQSCPNVKLLLRHYHLSDDIAFRFSNPDWQERPLYAEKFVHWMRSAALDSDVLNLFMDYETFGEHQWQETGIFDFLSETVRLISESDDFSFLTPGQASEKIAPIAPLDIIDYISWADEQRDLTAWLGNELQQDAFSAICKLEKTVKKLKNPQLLHTWQSLLTSDHFYYMCTKYNQDGDVHKYFSPYDNPYDAYCNFQNILSDFSLTLKNELRKKSIIPSKQNLGI